MRRTWPKRSWATGRRAIELNGVAVEKNNRAFDLGRLAIADPEALRRLTGDAAPAALSDRRARTLDEAVATRVAELTDARGAAMAKRYADVVERARTGGLSEAAVAAIARFCCKLLAVKDEWEVARLYAKPSFRKALEDTVEGDLELTFHFGAWPFGGKDETTGKMVKGPVSGKRAMRFFGLMNRLRVVRGTRLDPFRNNAEAQLARRVLSSHEDDIACALTNWSDARAADIVALLDLPEHIRGYGHVLERHVADVEKKREKLRAAILSDRAAAA